MSENIVDRMASGYAHAIPTITMCQNYDDMIADLPIYELLDMFAEVVKNDPHGMRLAERILLRDRIAGRTVL